MPASQRTKPSTLEAELAHIDVLSRTFSFVSHLEKVCQPFKGDRRGGESSGYTAR